MNAPDRYSYVESPAEFLTQCMVDRCGVAEYMRLSDDVFLPFWAHGHIDTQSLKRACGHDVNKSGALFRALHRRENTKQGFALLRMGLGASMFERRVTRTMGQSKAFPLFAQEMQSFEDCGSVADVQATLLAFTDAGKLYEGYGVPEMRSKSGEVYTSRAVYAQLQALHYIVGYTANRLRLRRGTVVDVRDWMGTISSWGNLRRVVARTADRKAFENDPENFHRVLESGVAERLPELEAESRAQQLPRDAEETPRTVLRRY